MGEVHRQMDAWRGSEAAGAPATGHLRLVTPSAGGSATGAGAASTESNSAETQALKDRVKDLESQLAESKRLIDIRSSELNALQHKLGAPGTPAAVPPAATPVPGTPATPAEPPAASAPSATPTPPVVVPATPPVKKPAAVAPADSGSWIDWVAANWWVPLAVLLLVIGGIGLTAMRRRRRDENSDLNRLMDDTDIADPTSQLSALRKGNESFVVEESGPHVMSRTSATSRAGSVDTGEAKAADDTLSSEGAVNLDQGDPLAEADFHMAYGLYDQAADLVRIALEREPRPPGPAAQVVGDLFRLGQQGCVPADGEGLGGHARPCAGGRMGQDRHHGQADMPGRAYVRLRGQRPRRGCADRPESRGR